MLNEHINRRLAGIHQQLLGAYEASSTMASATIGAERELFIDLFLSQVLPTTYRFGTGDITDSLGSKSGQLDVVIEHPFLPSLPIAGGSRYRLYLAESIASVLEIKSGLPSQWNEAVKTFGKLSNLKRNLSDVTVNMFGGQLTTTPSGSTVIQGMTFDGRNHRGAAIDLSNDNLKIMGRDIHAEAIPFFVIGYRGWKDINTLQRKVKETNVSGILTLDNPKFVTNENFGSRVLEGTDALWGFICALHDATKLFEKINVTPDSYFKKEPIHGPHISCSITSS